MVTKSSAIKIMFSCCMLACSTEQQDPLQEVMQGLSKSVSVDTKDLGPVLTSAGPLMLEPPVPTPDSSAQLPLPTESPTLDFVEVDMVRKKARLHKFDRLGVADLLSEFAARGLNRGQASYGRLFEGSPTMPATPATPSQTFEKTWSNGIDSRIRKGGNRWLSDRQHTTVTYRANHL
jgi:hypothetical protein